VGASCLALDVSEGRNFAGCAIMTRDIALDGGVMEHRLRQVGSR
jgi:hypothetical protein